jgi:serine/threonine protein kinase
MIESLGSFEGKYEIIEKIGEGGMGAVYKVKHTLLNEIRVIKTMRSHVMHEAEPRERFFREARIAAKARHQNIAQVFDFSVDGDVAFIVMEFIDGVTVQDIIAQHGPPTLPLALEIAQQSLRALAFVHSIGVIHRDISPDNLMLTTDSDGNPKIKLIDLGLAKATEAESMLTREGFFLGKLRYASPEQFEVHKGAQVGTWSDVYSFGLVFYQLVTGRYPVKGRDLPELMAGHTQQPPMPFEESDPDGEVPEVLRQAILRALEKKAANRYQDGNSFREQVLAIQVDHPWGQEEREESKRLSTRPPSLAEAEKPGSSQARLGRAFPVGKSSAGQTTATGDQGSEAGTAALADFAPDGTTPLPMPPEAAPTAGAQGSAAATQMREEGSRSPTQMRPESSRSPTQMRPEASRTPTQMREAAPPTPGETAAAEADRYQITSPRPVAVPEPAPSKTKWIVAAIGGVAVVAVAATLLLTGVVPLPGGGNGSAVTQQPGRLEIHAVPWARVVRVEDREGNNIELGETPFTPIALSLAPGSYRIVVRNDSLGEEAVWAEVQADTTTRELVPLAEIEADQLLRSLGVLE